jgi:predicted amidophosphoribosyltransferase
MTRSQLKKSRDFLAALKAAREQAPGRFCDDCGEELKLSQLRYCAVCQRMIDSKHR